MGSFTQLALVPLILLRFRIYIARKVLSLLDPLRTPVMVSEAVVKNSDSVVTNPLLVLREKAFVELPCKSNVQ